MKLFWPPALLFLVVTRPGSLAETPEANRVTAPIAMDTNAKDSQTTAYYNTLPVSYTHLTLPTKA